MASRSAGAPIIDALPSVGGGGENTQGSIRSPLEEVKVSKASSHQTAEPSS